MFTRLKNTVNTKTQGLDVGRRLREDRRQILKYSLLKCTCTPNLNVGQRLWERLAWPFLASHLYVTPPAWLTPSRLFMTG